MCRHCEDLQILDRVRVESENVFFCQWKVMSDFGAMVRRYRGDIQWRNHAESVKCASSPISENAFDQVTCLILHCHYTASRFGSLHLGSRPNRTVTLHFGSNRFAMVRLKTKRSKEGRFKARCTARMTSIGAPDRRVGQSRVSHWVVIRVTWGKMNRRCGKPGRRQI